MTDPTLDAIRMRQVELRKAIMCLYLEAHQDVAKDVSAKAQAVLADVDTLLDRLAERDAYWMAGLGLAMMSHRDPEQAKADILRIGFPGLTEQLAAMEAGARKLEGKYGV